MAFWKKTPSEPPDRMTPAALAEFGRYKFLGPAQVTQFDELAMVQPVLPDLYPPGTPGYAAVVSEVTRHASQGEWERVGGWKFAREYLSGGPGVDELIDGGFRALLRMRVTNLFAHLAPVDQRRWNEAMDVPIPNDGFFGPPVFDSEYGPTRQYYFDHALASATRRAINRVQGAAGAEPGPIVDTVELLNGLGNFGLLVYRGPLLVGPDRTFEQQLVGPAVAASQGVDHRLFVDRLAEVLFTDSFASTSWSSVMGAARFVEDYLDPSALEAKGYDQLLRHGLGLMISTGVLGVGVSAELLTFRQRARLTNLETTDQ